jgi:hypothetical protein
MSLSAAQTGLTTAYKDLLRRWERITEHWDDPVSREIEETFINELEPRIHMAANAMAKMTEVMHAADRECG